MIGGRYLSLGNGDAGRDGDGSDDGGLTWWGHRRWCSDVVVAHLACGVGVEAWRSGGSRRRTAVRPGPVAWEKVGGQRGGRGLSERLAREKGSS